MDLNNPEVKGLIAKAKRGEIQDVLASLTPEQKEQIAQILNSSEAKKKVLASPEAQQLLKLFMKGE
ncbi:MAG: hypothetical protein LBS74_01225 [Oscillospiraceae bacterium]|nr:hypothetical protein [Oscillospiraceae bacterium]